MKIEGIVYKTGTAFGRSEDIGIYALTSVMNDLAAEEPGIFNCHIDGKNVRWTFFNISVQIYLPFNMEKRHAYVVEKKIKRMCREQDIRYEGAQIEMRAGITQCLVIVTGIARAPKEEEWYRETMRAGQDIVLTKSIGMEGTLRILAEKDEILRTRFSPGFLAQIGTYQNRISALTEIETARKEGASFIRHIGGGGIFAALWRLSEDAGTGLETDIKKMPVEQETIEICEFFGLNPYQLASTGNFLLVTSKGDALADSLQRQGIEAAVIGKLTSNHDKVIKNGEERRYIDRPSPDELNKVFMEDHYGRI